MLPTGDARLIQIVDAAFAGAAVRSGSWLLCRPGCNQCCTGVFRISPLDVERLRDGLRQLDTNSPRRADRVRERVRSSAARLAGSYPGDLLTGTLHSTEEADAAFEEFANDEVCPVLDPLTGTCDLYSHRPLTCRTFGPPVETEEGLGTCELCFDGAPVEAVKAAAMHLPPSDLEQSLIEEMGAQGETIVTFTLATMG